MRGGEKSGYARRELCVCVRFQEFFEVGAECKRLYEYEYEETYTLRKMGREF